MDILDAERERQLASFGAPNIRRIVDNLFALFAVCHSYKIRPSARYGQLGRLRGKRLVVTSHAAHRLLARFQGVLVSNAK
jgi:hypothetical protein